ncbi:DEAD/DEAH box helicase [Thermococcus sp. LS2]|uniref:DEAD/DEAH box helicase n=1 Tax=unclassified Thermococcus TaxID=2627626 RepID=UPI001F0F538B|nr:MULTISPECIES: DEAD/DEAH box helicase [unclassified Thermococcus]
MRVDELSRFGVDERIIRKIKERGISEFYPPQAEALKSGVLNGENLLLAIPTASGKTLVAEIVMLHKLFTEGGKAVYLVPLKALAEEKYREFKTWEDLGVRVAVTTGDYDSSEEWLGRYDIIIATSEKFDSLLRHKSRWIKDVKLIVADEIHLLGSYDRGATLEMILSHMLGKAQILGLSATVGNAEELAEWLNARLVVSDWRPVKLRKGVFAHGQLIWEDGKIDKLPAQWDSLVIDAVKRGKQSLVFVNTRRSAEKEAAMLGKKVRRLLTKPEARRLKELAESLESNPTNDKLKEVLVNGAAFHHAGLGRAERTLIEDAFREGLIKVLTATPTLCMHPDTLVITRYGVKKVSELKRGDFVLTHTGEFKQVIMPLKRQHKGKLLVIKAFGTVPIKITPEHKVFVIKQIRHKSHYSNGRQVIWWEYEGPFWITARELKELIEQNNDPKISYMLLQPIPKLVVTVDKIPLRKPSKVVNQFGVTNRDHPALEKTPEFLPLNFETARLIGLWIAEGSTSKTGAILFDIASYEEDITSFLIQTISKYFPKAKIVVEDKERNRRRIRFCNKRFAEWLRKNIGAHADNKRIPEVILFNGNREVKLGLLKGLIEGDGYVRINARDRSNYITYSTVSPHLAYQLQLLLASLGYVSSVRYFDRKDKRWGRKGLYEVRISGKSYYSLLEELGYPLPKLGNRVYQVNKIWNGYLLLKVRRIEEQEYEGEVFNLEVEDNESYSVGFIVHNSAGVNLPSFRVIIRDTKRYSTFGWSDIPVLEIQQMMGRAGRPKYDKEGEAIIVAKTEKPEELMEKYIFGKPEKLFSMLSNDAAFRSQVLALITNFGVESFRELIQFLEKTFYYYQRKDLEILEGKAKSIVYFLLENEFIDIDLNDRFIALPFGIRTSQLYLDPLTAKKFKDALPQIEENPNPLGIFQLLASTPDMGTLSIKRKEQEDYLDYAYEMESYLYRSIPYWEDYEFQKFLSEVKTAKLLLDWINEVSEAKLIEAYGIDTGDLYRIIELADWLMYSLIELAKVLNARGETIKYLRRLHLRLKHGVREELLELVELPMIGRKRARALYNAGFKTVNDIVKAKPSELLAVEGIGVKVLERIYKHFGVELPLLKNIKDSDKSEEKKSEANPKPKKGTLDYFLK